MFSFSPDLFGSSDLYLTEYLSQCQVYNYILLYQNILKLNNTHQCNQWSSLIDCDSNHHLSSLVVTDHHWLLLIITDHHWLLRSSLITTDHNWLKLNITNQCKGTLIIIDQYWSSPSLSSLIKTSLIYINSAMDKTDKLGQVISDDQ